jgi:hypothetical protein
MGATRENALCVWFEGERLKEAVLGVYAGNPENSVSRLKNVSSGDFGNPAPCGIEAEVVNRGV